MATPTFPKDPEGRKYDWTGGEQDQYGFTESLPGHQYAPQQQFEADKVTRARQEMFMRQAELSQREGLGNLSTYRPGGAAALTSPYYQNMSNVLMSRAQMQYSPDLMHYWRWNQAHRARKASKRAATIGAIGAAVGGILPMAGKLIAGMGGSGAPGETPASPGQTAAPGGLQTQDDLGANIPGPSGSGGLSMFPQAFGASQGDPGVSRGTQEGAGGQQMAQGGGGQQQPGGAPQPGQPGGQPGQGGAQGGQMAMGGAGGMPPTEHPLGFQFGMAASLGNDMGIPNDQMLAMTMIDEDVGGPDGVPFLDFAEAQMDQMFFTLHEALRGDPSLGGYG